MSAASVRPRDVYANLLRDTRGMRREEANARDLWFTALPWERKEETLFELEMLWKGIACFGNPRNHPGLRSRSGGSQDFHEELRILRDACQRAVVLAKVLLGDKERAYTFTRYLESVLPEDSARGQLVQEQLTQDTPEEALFVIRNALSHFVELAEGLMRGPHTSNRTYFALHSLVVREVSRNTFFNPLLALEFRPEFDRIRNGDVLEAIRAIESDVGHRVIAMTFLGLFRARRYIALIDQYAGDAATVRLSYVMLAVLRSDMRTLSRYLRDHAGDALADGLESDIMTMPRAGIRARFDTTAQEMRRLSAIRATLRTLAGDLRVEIKRVFEYGVPPPQEELSPTQLAARLRGATSELRAALDQAVGALCAEIRPAFPPPELSSDLPTRRASSNRLRREIWMFQQIIRAFLAKAEATSTGSVDSPDRWAGQGSFQFVRDFIGHFQALGLPILRAHGYARLEFFLALLPRIRDVDLLDQHRLEEVMREVRSFLEFLGTLFERVTKRPELDGVPFDRSMASESLKIYLGRA